MNHYIWAKNLR